MIKILIPFIIISLFSGCAHIKSSIALSERHYVVVDVNVTDIKRYDEFLALEIPILKKYDAYIEMDIRSKDQKKRYIIVSFPNRKAGDRFVKSKEFQRILPMNKESANSKIFHGDLHKH